MSVCLAVTKSVATLSLGIYTGIVTTRSISNTNEGLFSKRAINLVTGGLALSSTIFFGLSYFGAPLHWKHPYLLYCFVGVPISWISNILSERAPEGNDSCEKRVTDDDSIVDLGEKSIGSDSETDNTPLESNKCRRYGALGFTLMVFVINIIGCLGESLYSR